jgi:uncharacterized LabA/DUF88 family protein
MPTAILIDGGFFLKRFPFCYPSKDKSDPKVVARAAFELALSHLDDKDINQGKRQLYRIFFYDCPPILKKAQYPISRRPVDFSKTSEARFRLALHDELRCLRKVALRLGHLADGGEWRLKAGMLKVLLSGSKQFSDLTDDDFVYDVRQKGVDMRIGMDISSLAIKNQVDQIVLVAGDADFVPAAKLARREGLDFVLDPMWNPIPRELNEHIDGLRSAVARPAPGRGGLSLGMSVPQVPSPMAEREGR